MFAVIFTPDFSLQAVLRHEPELLDSAVALLDGTETKAVIWQMTAAARATEVLPGMTPAQAMARCPRISIKSRSLAQEESAQQTLLQCAYAFSPSIESTGPGICTMNLQGLAVAAGGNADLQSAISLSSARQPSGMPIDDRYSAKQDGSLRHGRPEVSATTGFTPPMPHLPLDIPESPAQGSLRAWALRLIDTLARLRLRVQIGVAASPDLALHAAQCAQPFLVIDHSKDFLAQQPIEQIKPSPQVLELLHRWGIRNLGELMALGKDRLAARLGPAALELFERATASQSRPLKVVHPPQIFEEAIEFQNEVETLEPLLFILRRFLEQITQRLEMAYLVVEEIDLTLNLASGDCYQRNFKVPAPTRAVETLFRMLYTHLETLKTEAPIIAFRLCAKPGHAEGYQLGLFEASLRDPNHFSETIARLKALLGEDRIGTPVMQPSYRPDDFRMEPVRFGDKDSPASPATRARLRSKSSSSSKVCPSRRRYGPALRRFRPALPINVELEGNKPAFFRNAKLKAKIVRASGPWRLSGDWWDRSWKRDEWDIETATGRGYRIYQEGDNWFLEAMFD
jgi:protein ImuB